MYTIVATFLVMYITFNYLTIKDKTFKILTANLPKPLSCGACLSFWVILILSTFQLYSMSEVVVVSASSFLLYQILYKYV